MYACTYVCIYQVCLHACMQACKHENMNASKYGLTDGWMVSRSDLTSVRDPASGLELQCFGFTIWEFPKIRGTLFWGPYNKDPTI